MSSTETPPEFAGPALHPRFAGLPLRLLLAALSGVGSAIWFKWQFDPLSLDWPDFVVPGVLFGVAVLGPHLRPDRSLYWRAAALSAASVLSLFCAVSIVLNASGWLGLDVGLPAFVLAGLGGGAIAMIAARWLLPLRAAAAFWPLGAIASVLGGASLHLGSELFGGYAGMLTGFTAWHVLMSLALHFGCNVNVGQSPEH